jgi:hypothetical protein
MRIETQQKTKEKTPRITQGQHETRNQEFTAEFIANDSISEDQ